MAKERVWQAVVMVAAMLVSPPLCAQTTLSQTDSAAVTLEGLVRDISCVVQNPAATSRRFNRQCALECARRGGALAIQTDSGTLYIPISGATPDSGARDRLLPFVGKYVRVTGTAFERRGLHAIAIQSIIELPHVALVTDAN